MIIYKEEKIILTYFIPYCSEMQNHEYLNIYHMWSVQNEDMTKVHDKKQHQIVPWWFLVYTAACYGNQPVNRVQRLI